MKLNHLISSIDISLGGPSKSVSDLASNLAKKGQDVTITCKSSPNPYLSKSSHSNLFLHFINNSSFKNELKKMIDKENYNILHGHGIWQMPVHIMCKLAKEKKIPYIITPRGMLEPWSLIQNKWKKKLAMLLYQKKDLANANCIHVTAQMELKSIRELGFKNPIALIPNGIDLMDFPIPENKPQRKKRTVLFLSRIHKKKGIEILIEAWGKINKQIRNEWKVEIAGNGELNYIDSLKKLIVKLGLKEDIKIIGPQFGKNKTNTYHRADLFVLPTYSENFGVVVAEALACEIPVITTKGAPWEELNTFNAGWWIDIGIEPMIETLQFALHMTDEELLIKGKNGRKLITEKYSIESVADQMIELYDWILTKNKTPNFIYVD